MDRKKILFKNISLSFLYKAVNMGLVFITIPLLLNYLEKELYGIWVTIFSIVNIVFFMDGGIGNGLKTKLSESISIKDVKLSKTYITNSYAIVGCFAFAIFCILSITIYFVDLKQLLNTSIPNAELKIVFWITLVLITLAFVLNLYKSFFYSKHQAAKVELSILIYQLIVLSVVSLLLYFFPSKLLYVAITYGISNLLVCLFFTLYFFKKNPKLIPSKKSFDKSKMRELLGLSIEFFIIQLCLIVILSTDNIIISNLLGPKEVTSYDVVYKLFSLLIVLSVIFQDPFWALYTDAYKKKDTLWIRKTIKKLNFVFIPFCFLVLLFFLFSESFIKIWLQKDLNISKNLVLFTSLFVLVRVYGIIYTQFLNAIGKIKLQMWLFIFGALINIPLSYFFVEKMKLGNSGVVLGTLCSILSIAIVLPFQTYKILKVNEAN